MNLWTVFTMEAIVLVSVLTSSAKYIIEAPYRFVILQEEDPHNSVTVIQLPKCNSVTKFPTKRENTH